MVGRLKLRKLFNRPMSELELIYNAASLADGSLNGHMSGLIACMEHGRRIERESLEHTIVDRILAEVK